MDDKTRTLLLIAGLGTLLWYMTREARAAPGWDLQALQQMWDFPESVMEQLDAYGDRYQDVWLPHSGYCLLPEDRAGKIFPLVIQAATVDLELLEVDCGAPEVI